MGMMPSISTGDIDLSKFVDFEGYKSTNTYNIQQESSTKYYIIGAIIILFLFFKKK